MGPARYTSQGELNPPALAHDGHAKLRTCRDPINEQTPAMTDAAHVEPGIINHIEGPVSIQAAANERGQLVRVRRRRGGRIEVIELVVVGRPVSPGHDV